MLPVKILRVGNLQLCAQYLTVVIFSVDLPSLARLEKDYTFQCTIVPFIQAIRTETIAFEHASVVLSHYGRFGVMYDSLAKVLVEMLRENWRQGDTAPVTMVVKSSMRGVCSLTYSATNSVLTYMRIPAYPGLCPSYRWANQIRRAGSHACQSICYTFHSARCPASCLRSPPNTQPC
jgi:hypothetical protein